MLCSGWNVVAQSAGNCVAIVLVLVDGLDNEHCSFSQSFFKIHLPLFCLLPGLSPMCSAHEGWCDPSGRREGRALGTPRCIVGAGSHSTIALQWDWTTYLAALSCPQGSLSVQSPSVWVVGALYSVQWKELLLCIWLLHLGPKSRTVLCHHCKISESFKICGCCCC